MSRDHGAPFDTGLQPERTALSWRRTALALGIGPVVAARLLAPELGALAAVAAATGVVLGLGVLVGAGLRYRRIQTRLTGAQAVDVGHPRLPGAGLLAVTAGIPLAAGSVVLVVVVSRLF